MDSPVDFLRLIIHKDKRFVEDQVLACAFCCFPLYLNYSLKNGIGGGDTGMVEQLWYGRLWI